MPVQSSSEQVEHGTSLRLYLLLCVYFLSLWTCIC